MPGTKQRGKEGKKSPPPRLVESENMKERYRRIKDYSLSSVEQLLFSENKWSTTAQAKKALQTIRRRYLKEDERVLLSLKGMHPPKLDREIAELLGVHSVTACWRWKRLRELIVAYSWWLQNSDAVCYLVNKRLGPLHKRILLLTIQRKTNLEVATHLGITQWMVWKRMRDNLLFLRHKKDFEKFFKDLRMGYHL
jgi:DNA-binding CsgD family transcriptional regulator